jgi:hypothetical protein
MVPSHIADHVLQADTNHSRFEKFCCDLSTVVEGRDFVPTSATWDRGRDARAVGPARGTHAAVICCTLDPDLDAKSNQDLTRLAATSKPDRVIYCSSQKLSEHQLDKVAGGICGLLRPDASVATYGSLQLASLAERHPEPFEKHYRAELQNIHAMLSDSA